MASATMLEHLGVHAFCIMWRGDMIGRHDAGDMPVPVMAWHGFNGIMAAYNILCGMSMHGCPRRV
jgi:hypothetical protein